MRIITGKAKGIKLLTLEGEQTRPTAERTKQAIFSSLQFDLDGRAVLDLFAGSGQMGLEALSRGAVSCMFIDASPEAMAIIKENAKNTKLFDQARFLISDYRSYIRKASKRDAFSLIILDPPYGMHCVGDAISRIIDAEIAVPGCIFVCESGEDNIFEGKEELQDQFETIKKSRYGVAYVHILQYKGEDDHAL
ncbi:MAG: 16S rRNA (guanine(966)-N(2))-methyltransferase RsmD [Clostridia bacterium]|nr:16S rRNA (guanine(966)-N(2))-methyltransferase RsmD [Clostridia bacterium]